MTTVQLIIIFFKIWSVVWTIIAISGTWIILRAVANGQIKNWNFNIDLKLAVEVVLYIFSIYIWFV